VSFELCSALSWSKGLYRQKSLPAQSCTEGQNFLRVKGTKNRLNWRKDKSYGLNSRHKTLNFLCAFAALREVPVVLNGHFLLQGY